MTSRERVLTALSHEEPDRVPLPVGTSGVTTILGAGYEQLKTHLGILGWPPRWISRPLQYAWFEEDIMARLGSDGRPMMPGSVPSRLAREISTTELVDAWGCRWARRPGVPYFEVRVAGRYPFQLN